MAFKKGLIPWNKGKKCPEISAGLNGHKVKKESIVKYIKTRRENNIKLGRKPWNKGLTKETDERVKKYGQQGSIKYLIYKCLSMCQLYMYITSREVF